MLKLYNTYIKQLFLKHFSYAPTTILYAMLGRVFYLFHKKHGDLYDILFSDQSPDTFSVKCIKAYALYRYYNLPDTEQFALNKKYYWGGSKGTKWNENTYTKVMQNGISPYKREVFSLAKRYAADFDAVVEIGTGNGTLLKLMHDEFGTGKSYIGLDLSQEQIHICQDRYKDTSIHFACMRFEDWAQTFRKNAKLLIISVTALQFFNPSEISSLFAFIKSNTSSRLILCEPVNINIDYIRRSVPRGGTAYSHNYPHMLRDALFNVDYVTYFNVSSVDKYYSNIAVVASHTPS